MYISFQQHIIQQTAHMLVIDNSQISQESMEQNSPRSSLRALSHFRESHPEEITSMDQYCIHEAIDENQQGESSLSSEEQIMMLKIRQQTQLILDLQEKQYYYRTQCLRLIDQNQSIKENERHFQRSSLDKQQLLEALQRKMQEQSKTIGDLSNELKKKQQKIVQLGKTIERNAQRKQKEISFRNTYNQQLLSKQLLLQQKIILQLSTKNEKLIKINSFLERQLTIAEEKLINYEMDVQQKMCSILVDNVFRLKDNQMNFSKSLQNYSIPPTNIVCEGNFSSTLKPNLNLEQGKTTKLHGFQEMQLNTIEKDRLLFPVQYRYEYKLDPVQSPKPQRKSNKAISFHNPRRDMRQQRYKQVDKIVEH